MNMNKIFHMTVVFLLTSLLLGCFMYDELVYDNPYDPDADGGVTLEYRTMQIDADTSDWDDVPVIRDDDTGENANSGAILPPGCDIDEIKMVQDDDNIYFYYLFTADGSSPLSGSGDGIHTSFNHDDYNIQFNFAHDYNPPASNFDSEGRYSSWGYYDYWAGENPVNEDIAEPPIRFAGIEHGSNNMEFAISKTLYWDYAQDEELRFEAGTYSSYYEELYFDGGCDDIDETGELYIQVKDTDAADPNSDIPVMQFERPSVALAIDGNNSDMSIWSETGVWFQDFWADDDNMTEPNTDIDKVYIKQDDSIIYFLITFYDPGPYTLVNSINIGISLDDPGLYHSFQADYTGAVWQNEQVNYDASTDATDCLAMSSDGYLELQFGKYLQWADMPIASMNFRIEIYDSAGTPTDDVQFYGTYKSSTDPAP